MRMWKVDPKIMCNKHLVGEHVEMHMFIGAIKKHKNLKGYLDKGLVEIHNIRNRHEELAQELARRGFKHNSPLPDCDLENKGFVNIDNNILELHMRCVMCRCKINLSEYVEI